MTKLFTKALMLLAVMLTGSVAVAQVAHSFSAGNLSYSQDFDGMTATGTTYPTGWNGARVAGSGTAGQALNPAVTDGGANSGAVYNVGTTGATDRALGTLASGSTVPAFGASFSNNTGGLINSFTINAFHEQWRSGSSATANEVVFFEYSFNATGIHDPAATWDSIPSLNLNEILTTTTTAAAVNGNDSANRVAITGTATGLSWAAGTTLWIRWRDFDHPGNDGIYAVDDFNMTVTTGGGSTPTTSIITYRVDITGLTAPNGVNIAGSFNGWNATANPMTQVGTTNVYQFVDTVNINDTIAYKFIIAGTPATWEDLNGPCNIGGNRQVIASAPTISLPAVAMSRCNVYNDLVDVTLRISMDSVATISPNGVHVAGNFQRPSHWQPGASQATSQGGNVFAFTFKGDPNTAYQYKFLNGNSWGTDETVPGPCAVNGNRQILVGAGNSVAPIFFFGTCSQVQQSLTLRTIASIRGVDSIGVADSAGTVQRLTGTLHGLNHYRSTTVPVGLQWFMLDGTGGITIRRAGTTFGLTLNPGDSVIVEGTLTQFNGLLQMNVDTLIRVATGRALQQPTVVTHPTEATENNFIRINGLTIASGTWPAVNANGFIQVTNGTQTFEMFIISILNNPRWTQPTGVFDLIGFGAQNDNSTPFTSGYQIVPMTNADIIPVAVTQPTLNFGRADTLVTNQVTSFPMFINILNPVNNAATVRVAVRTSAGVTYGATGNFNTAPAAVNDTIDLAVAANAAFTGFSMQLNGNVPVGRTDTVTFTIVSATGGLNIGAISASRVRITNPLPPAVTNLNIAQIRGNNTNGIADSIGVRVRTRGVVLGFNKRPAGLEFHIFDRSVNTGISVFRASGNLGYNVTEGDSVEVVGLVAHFNGLSQINVDSVTVRTTGNTIPAPVVVTALNEFSESRLVRINNLTLVDPTQWPVAGTTGTGRTMRVTNGVDSFDLRVVSATTLWGTPVPTGPFDAIGIGGQFFSASPHTGGYQLIPRYLQDLVTGGASADSINNFALVSPANNSSLTIEGAQTTEINVRWNQATWTGGTANFTYTWLVDLPTGDFSTPLAIIPSNNSGADTVLTLNFGAIAALLDANGIPQGMSATLKWTVRAIRTGSTDTKLATQPFTLTLTRGVMSSVAENALEGMKLYPNPASGRAYLTYNLPVASNLQLELINMIGKRVHVEVLHNTSGGVAELDLANLPEGVYFVRLSNEAYSATRRLVVKH